MVQSIVMWYKWLNGFKYRKGLNSSFLPIDGTLTGTTTPGQSGVWSNCNEGVLHIPQSPRTGVTPSNAV